jgi:hypothetical protein
MSIKRKLLNTIKESITLCDEEFVETITIALNEDEALDDIVQDAKVVAKKYKIKIKRVDISHWKGLNEVQAELSIDPKLDKLVSKAGKKILMVLTPGQRGSYFAEIAFHVGSEIIVYPMPANEISKRDIDDVKNYIIDVFA